MPRDQHTCRGAQLFGAWAIEPERFGRLVGSASKMGLDRIMASHEASLAAARDQQRQRFQVAGDGVAVIEVSGPLTKHASSFQAMFGGTATLDIRRAVRAALADPDVKSILLRIDSPGGIVDGTADLVDDIRDAASQKATWAYIEDLGASAGYWIAAATDRIVANRTAMVGSIGVFAVLEDTSGAAELAGVKVHVVRTGPHKGAGVDGAPISEDDISDVQRVIDSTFRVFSRDVSSSRELAGEKLDAVTTGQVWIADEARKLGLVDAIDTLASTITKLGRSRTRPVAAKGAASTKGTAMHQDIDKNDPAGTKAEAASTTAPAPKPATMAQLKAEFPDAGADFWCECAETDMTIEQARKANALRLQKENAALKEKLAARDAEAAGTKRRIGAPPVPDEANKPQLSALASVEAKVDELVAAGMKRHDAHAKVMRQNPGLRDALVQEANARR